MRRAWRRIAFLFRRRRDVWIWPWLQDVSQDLRFALRMLTKDRRFTLAAVVALGLGVGLNNSVFAIINATLIRDVPFDRADQLLRIQGVEARGEDRGLSLLDLQYLQQSARTFEGLRAETAAAMNVSDESRAPERVRGAFVSTNLFSLLRVTPVLGRSFRADEDVGDAPRLRSSAMPCGSIVTTATPQ